MLLALVMSLYNWKYLKKPDKWISLLLFATFVSESLAYYFRVRFYNNMYVYHIFNPLQLIIISQYFADAVPALRKRRVGLWIGIAVIVLAIFNAAYLQPLDTFPSVLLLFEGFCIIILSLLSFYGILYKEDIKIARNAQFWISALFLIFWSFTFLMWGSYMSVAKLLHDKLKLIYDMLIVINFTIYTGFFIIFLFYRKLIPSGE
jgi:uncharacterized membrane protein YsdA (DUF1294 family)